MKIVKRVLLVVLALIAVLVMGVSIRFYVLLPHLRPATEVKAPSTPEAIERGRYLANHVTVCVGCHSDVDVTISGEPIKPGRTGSGRVFHSEEGDMIKIRAPNLTPDPETGLGKWTDGEILRAMREGIAKDGTALFPMMPYQTFHSALGDADALAVIAYLRSLPPIKNDVGRTLVGFPVSMFIRAEPAPVETSAPPLPSDHDKRGQVLLTLASCHDCHDTVDAQHHKLPGREFAGGNEFKIPGKGSVFTANITSDKATGIGSYSDEDIVRVIREGKNKAGRVLYIMPWSYYSGMTDEDLHDLIGALRKTPPIVNVPPQNTIKL